MNYKHSCVIDAERFYKTLVLVLLEPDEDGNLQEKVQHYELLKGESLVETTPPTMRPHAGATGLIKPRWSTETAAWEEAATEAEIAVWEAEHPAPAPVVPPADDLAGRVATLEADKANKAEVQAVWDSIATAYSEGVQRA